MLSVTKYVRISTSRRCVDNQFVHLQLVALNYCTQVYSTRMVSHISWTTTERGFVRILTSGTGNQLVLSVASQLAVALSYLPNSSW